MPQQVTNQQGTFTVADPTNNPYDTFLQHIVNQLGGPNAYSRITKAPIYFNKIPSSIGPAVIGSTNPISTFNPSSSNRINITYGGDPSFKDFMGILSHEDIHAALNSIPEYNNGYGVKDVYLDNKLYNSFKSSNRAGNPWLEIPAYTGAFKLGELPGVNQLDADQFIDDFVKKLPKEVQTKVNKVINTYKSSQKNLPTKVY